MTTRISAQAVSAALARAGFTRSTKVPGGRGGVLSPITEGFKVWGRGSRVLVDHLPHGADRRDEQLAELAVALEAAGYQVTPASDRGDLEVSA